MGEEQSGRPESALAELRLRLVDGLATAGLGHKQLVTQSGLSRTTVYAALKEGGSAPSAATVVALARVLKLPVPEMQELRRDAAGGVSGDGPGRPIGHWEPHALEVHPAGSTPGGSGSVEQRVLPGYVRREHDRVLEEAVREAGRGCSRMVVLVGDSSTGKTRACWEAVQPLAEKGWRLWHPFDPTRAEAALEELHGVGPRTVVWLNEAQHYLGGQAYGEQVAAAIHALLVEPERGPVLVLGTLWHKYFMQYTALPGADGADPHSRVRELLAGRTTSVPEAFEASELGAAALLAKDDVLLADALTRARADGRLCQDLAGGPALLERYENSSPVARAMLEAAMDARRLGVGLHIPQAFLTDAAVDYVHDSDWDQLTEDWAEQAYAELAKQVHGKQAPLRRVSTRPQRRPPRLEFTDLLPQSSGPVFRLADYLEQHGTTARLHHYPPASFWNAAFAYLTQADDLVRLANAALRCHRLQWAHHLYLRGADYGDTYALAHLAGTQERAGDPEGAEAFAVRAADRGDPGALTYLARQREEAGNREGAKSLYQRAADHGDPGALTYLARQREEAGDSEGAEAFAVRAAALGDTYALSDLAGMREEAGDRDGAKSLYQRAADRGDPGALTYLARQREEVGDRDGAKSLYQRAADRGNTYALARLARQREEAGDSEGAEAFAVRAAALGDTYALSDLAGMREEAGDRDGAEPLALRAADHGDPSVLMHLVRSRYLADQEGAESLAQRAADRGDTFALARLGGMREEAGDRSGATSLYQRAADRGDTDALARLVEIREEEADQEGAESLARLAAAHGDPRAWLRLAAVREKAGDLDGATSLYQRAADQRAAGHGAPQAWLRLAAIREKSGDLDGATSLYQRAVNHGIASHPSLWRTFNQLWPYGLDPDGTPTRPWTGAAEAVPPSSAHPAH